MYTHEAYERRCSNGHNGICILHKYRSITHYIMYEYYTITDTTSSIDVHLNYKRKQFQF